MGQDVEEQAYGDARRILRTLMLGVNPESHTRLSLECVVMQPEVKTALALGVEALRDTEWVRRWRKKQSKTQLSTEVVRRTSMPKFSKAAQVKGHAGQAWSKQEDARLCSAYYQGRSCQEIAVAHGRTSGAISARLVRLGLVASRQKARTTSR